MGVFCIFVIKAMNYHTDANKDQLNHMDQIQYYRIHTLAKLHVTNKLFIKCRYLTHQQTDMHTLYTKKILSYIIELCENVNG